LLTGLVRFLISMVMLAAFVWFAVTVPLGKRTLWGHVHAIFGTQEARDLAEGTKEEAEKVAQKVKAELHPADMATPAATPRAPAPAPSAPRHVKVPLPQK
jgi:hypothetical protein